MDAASAKSRFLANVSHELRTPLNACNHRVPRGSCRGTREGLPTKQVEKPLQGSAQRRTAAGAHRRHSRPLASRRRTCRRRGRPRRTSLTSSARPWSRSNHWSTNSRGRINVDVERAQPPIVTDGDKVKQILLNLLSNAVKYTDEGAINVRAGVANGWLRVSVADTGLGVAADELYGFSMSFTAPTRRQHVHVRAPGSAWRSRGASRRHSVATSPSRAGSAPVPPSPSTCRSTAPKPWDRESS